MAKQPNKSNIAARARGQVERAEAIRAKLAESAIDENDVVAAVAWARKRPAK